MAWVNCGRYYQISVRENGRITTRYIGGGWMGEAADLIRRDCAEQLREARQEAREREAEHRAEWEAERERGERIRDLVTLGCEVAGFVRHSRHGWRKRRMGRTQTPARPSAPSDLEAEIRRAVAACKSGKPGAIARLRELGREYPAMVLDATIGDTYRWAKQALRMVLLADRSPGQDYVREGVALKLKTLALELAGEDPSPVRRLCAQAAAFAYVEFWLIQSAATANQWTGPAQLRRLAAAQKRHLASLRALAQIERAERPRSPTIIATQVNLGTPAIDQRGELPAFPGKS
jgi:hypothetical protein